MSMRYFKRHWNETRGDKFDYWGFSIIYNELAEDFYVNRQVEIYDNETVLKYDMEHIDDEFGMLCDQSLEEVLDDPDTIKINQDEFEQIWALKRVIRIK